MMVRISIAGLACLWVAACSPVAQGGEGVTSRGEPLVAETLLGYDGVNQVSIISANGWSCSGSYDKKQFAGSVARNFPISCTNGAKGNAVMSINSTQQRAAVAFSLNNGTSGKVAFGIVS